MVYWKVIVANVNLLKAIKKRAYTDRRKNFPGRINDPVIVFNDSIMKMMLDNYLDLIEEIIKNRRYDGVDINMVKTDRKDLFDELNEKYDEGEIGYFPNKFVFGKGE